MLGQESIEELIDAFFFLVGQFVDLIEAFEHGGVFEHFGLLIFLRIATFQVNAALPASKVPFEFFGRSDTLC